MKRLLLLFLIASGIFSGSVARADNNCTGATYYDADSDSCVACLTGYDANTTPGKVSPTECQIHCDAGTYADSYTEL